MEKLITIYTDHQNLTWFMSMKVLNRWQVRWWETLSEYNLEIKHVRGKENTLADALSRWEDHKEGVEPVAYTVLMMDPQGTIRVNRELNTTYTITNDLQTCLIEAYQQDKEA